MNFQLATVRKHPLVGGPAALWSLLVGDLTAFRHRLAPARGPQPGLHTYRLETAGGRRRVHLRIEDDGRGVLLIDASQVIHLNGTAAEMAQWALDGVSRPAAQARLIGRAGRRGRRQWQPDLDAIYELIARLDPADDRCPGCALGSLEHVPPFSAPVAAPYKADLALTYRCNNDCPHCYNEAERFELPPLPLQDWQRIVDGLCRAGVPHLIFTGGEPTLFPHLPELIAHADRLGPLCGLNTNGRRLARRGDVDELVAAGLNHVQITLGSHRADVHERMTAARSFRQTIRGIENAVASPLHTITNTTLMRMNAGQIEQTIELLHQLGIRTFAVNGMIHSGGGRAADEQALREDELAPLLVRIRDRAEQLDMRLLWYTPTRYCRLSPLELELGAKRCNAAEYSICVEPNGDVLPCQSYYAAAGNLLRDPWETIWNGSLFRSLRDRVGDPVGHGLPVECEECPDLELCGGGCPLERAANDSENNALPIVPPGVEESRCSGSCGPRATGRFAECRPQANAR